MRSAKAKGGPGIRVLVAEDDGRRRNAMRGWLTKLGSRVRTVDNPYDIMAEVGSFKPHVLFLDDRFSVSGVEYRAVLAKLRERFPSLKVVVTYPDDGAIDGEGHDVKTAPMVWGAIGSLSKKGMLDPDSVKQSVLDAVNA